MPRVRALTVVLFLICGYVIFLVAQTQQAPPAQPRPSIPDKFTSLQVLPRTIAKSELVGIMKAVLHHLQGAVQLLPRGQRRSLGSQFRGRRQACESRRARPAAQNSRGEGPIALQRPSFLTRALTSLLDDEEDSFLQIGHHDVGPEMRIPVEICRDAVLTR